MKKVFSFVLAIIMAMSLCVPAFAIERDPNTEELYEELDCKSNKFTYEQVTNFSHGELYGEVFHLYAFAAYNGSAGMDAGYDVVITPNEGVDVTITRIEARLTGNSGMWQYAGISGGTKDQNCSQKYGSWVSISNINDDEFSFGGGASVYINCIKVFYTCDSHNWNENGNCKSCDAQICETTGEHTWDDNGKCLYCDKFLCDETGEHVWKDDGHCQYCDVLKCNVTGVHDHTTETQTPAYIVRQVCDYCGETISEEVVEANNNAASIFGEGNVLIISSIICILLGLGGGYLLGVKKKTK